MKRNDFVFTLGYSGDTAIVDQVSQKRYGRLNTEQLLAKGLFRFAFCSAFYSENPSEMQQVMNQIAADCKADIHEPAQLMRLFGVYAIPSEKIKVKYL